ncbi:hypothetical protein GCM10009603_56790 [Nocardiopsis exhalans]
MAVQVGDLERLVVDQEEDALLRRQQRVESVLGLGAHGGSLSGGSCFWGLGRDIAIRLGDTSSKLAFLDDESTKCEPRPQEGADFAMKLTHHLSSG